MAVESSAVGTVSFKSKRGSDPKIYAPDGYHPKSLIIRRSLDEEVFPTASIIHEAKVYMTFGPVLWMIGDSKQEDSVCYHAFGSDGYYSPSLFDHFGRTYESIRVQGYDGYSFVFQKFEEVPYDPTLVGSPQSYPFVSFDWRGVRYCSRIELYQREKDGLHLTLSPLKIPHPIRTVLAGALKQMTAPHEYHSWLLYMRLRGNTLQFICHFYKANKCFIFSGSEAVKNVILLRESNGSIGAATTPPAAT